MADVFARKKSSPGQSLTELAFILPILMLIMAGILDLGRFAFAAATVANAAREGARYGAANPCSGSCPAITTRAQNEAYGSVLNPANLNVSSVNFPSGCALGNPIQVTVAYQFQLITMFVVGGGNIPIRVSDQMPVFGTCP